MRGHTETEGEEMRCTIPVTFGEEADWGGTQGTSDWEGLFLTLGERYKGMCFIILHTLYVHLFNKCFYRTYCALGTILSALEIIFLLTQTIFYGHEIIHNKTQGVGH